MMPLMDTQSPLLLAGHLMLPAGDGKVELLRGWIEVAAGKIEKVESGDPPRSPDAGGPHHVISPGWIDAHLHLPQFDCRGVHGQPLLEWLEATVFPAEARWSDPDHAERRATAAFQQLLAVGTTGIAAYSSNHPEATLRALTAARDIGLRATIGQALSDQQLPENLAAPPETSLSALRETLGLFPAGGRVEASIAPRFALTCSDSLLRGAGKMAAEAGVVVQTHLAETAEESAVARQRHHALSYTSIYADAGLLSDRTLLAHGIYLDERELSLIRESRSVVVHCPTANSFLRSGTMPLEAWRREGIRFAIGSDIAGGFELAMPRVARSMLELTFYSRSTPPSAAEAWWMITGGNAEALGWSNAGRLETGCAADLLLLSPPPGVMERGRPLEELLWGWDNRWLDKVFLEGQPVAPTENHQP